MRTTINTVQSGNLALHQREPRYIAQSSPVAIAWQIEASQKSVFYSSCHVAPVIPVAVSFKNEHQRRPRMKCFDNAGIDYNIDAVFCSRICFCLELQFVQYCTFWKIVVGARKANE